MLVVVCRGPAVTPRTPPNGGGRRGEPAPRLSCGLITVITKYNCRNYSRMGTSIPVSTALRDDLRDDKPDGVTWDEYVRGLYEDGEVVVEPAEVGVGTIEAVIDAVGAEVGGPAVDDTALAREVAGQIDYTELADTVADEVERRMR